MISQGFLALDYSNFVGGIWNHDNGGVQAQQDADSLASYRDENVDASRNRHACCRSGTTGYAAAQHKATLLTRTSTTVSHQESSHQASSHQASTAYAQ